VGNREGNLVADETGGTSETDKGSRFPDLRTSNFILRLMHDVILSPILHVAPFSHISRVTRYGPWPLADYFSILRDR
jgi:hypothetical protein